MATLATNLSAFAGPFETEALAEIESGAALDYSGALKAAYEKENVLPWGQGDLESSVLTAMRTGVLFPSYVPGTQDCVDATGAGIAKANNDLKLVSTTSGLALTAVGTLAGAEVSAAGGVAAAEAAGGAVGAAAGISAAIPIIGGIVAGIIGLFALIFLHHKQAVAKEQDVLCAAVPAANNYLNIIRDAVANGQATPAEGIQAINSLLSDFNTTVGPIRKAGPTQCNAACAEWEQLKAIGELQSEEYQQMINSPVAAPVAAVSGVVQTVANTVSAIVSALTGTGVAAPAPAQPSIAAGVEVSPTGAAMASVSAGGSGIILLLLLGLVLAFFLLK